MGTVIKSASTKVMLSYDYSHFEASMSLENEEGVSKQDVDNARKDCQRLCDKAVRQYVIAKEKAALRNDGKYQMKNFEAQCQKIILKSEGDRTINEVAMLKQYENEQWRSQFQYDYDYEDDEPELN